MGGVADGRIDRCPMGPHQTPLAQTEEAGSSQSRRSKNDQRNSLGSTLRRLLEKHAHPVWFSSHLLASFNPVGRSGGLGPGLARHAQEPGRRQTLGVGQRLSGFQLCSSQKRGSKVGITKLGRGTKRSLLVDGNGIPLAATINSGNVHDIRLAHPTLAKLYLPGHKGRPRTRVSALGADKAYDSRTFMQSLRRRGIRPCIPQREYADHKSYRRMSKILKEVSSQRWIVERTFSWLANFRRLTHRWDRHVIAYQGFFTIACIMICAKKLP